MTNKPNDPPERAEPAADDALQERERLFPKSSAPFFDASRIDGTKNEFVAWVDLMGAKAAMGRSLFQAANFIGKIHTATFNSLIEGVRAYPVIDGSYITATQKDKLEDVLRAIMCSLTTAFVTEQKMSQRLLVRGGIAAGRVIPGAELQKGSTALSSRSGYSDAVALGTAIGQAYMAEREAPPYGFFVDITARSFAVGKKQPFTSVYWRWWDDGNPEDVRRRDIIHAELDLYYGWLRENHRMLEYPLASLDEHRDRAKEYFRGAGSGSVQ